jgi:hypothetical protein
MLIFIKMFEKSAIKVLKKLNKYIQWRNWNIFYIYSHEKLQILIDFIFELQF